MLILEAEQIEEGGDVLKNIPLIPRHPERLWDPSKWNRRSFQQ
jgi:hypothetical protein